MSIVTVTAADRAEFLNLVDAEIRPDHAKTNAWDDFPVILGASNSQWQLLYKADDGTIAGCIACLIRDHQTSCGVVPVAGIGSVVTHPNFRNQGISKALQNELLLRLKGKNIPLGVLWTDQPEIYAGRGFFAAGWEIHVSVAELAISEPINPNYFIRPFDSGDTDSVQALYDAHPLRTIRNIEDGSAYYNMAGTSGFVVANSHDQIVAAAFCGKGGDFPDYITEYSGDLKVLPYLFHHLREKGLAQQVLLPPGTDDLVNALVDLGCSWMATPSGQWIVLDPQALAVLVRESGAEAPDDMADPAAWLGTVDSNGQPLVGPLTCAVWGFDSV